MPEFLTCQTLDPRVKRESSKVREKCAINISAEEWQIEQGGIGTAIGPPVLQDSTSISQCYPSHALPDPSLRIEYNVSDFRAWFDLVCAQCGHLRELPAETLIRAMEVWVALNCFVTAINRRFKRYCLCLNLHTTVGGSLCTNL